MAEDPRSEEYGSLQRLVDSLFRNKKKISQITLIVHAEAVDLCPDMLEVCKLVPPGSYTRRKLCDQLNSSIGAHAWGTKYGTVE